MVSAIMASTVDNTMEFENNDSEVPRLHHDAEVDAGETEDIMNEPQLLKLGLRSGMSDEELLSALEMVLSAGFDDLVDLTKCRPFLDDLDKIVERYVVHHDLKLPAAAVDASLRDAAVVLRDEAQLMTLPCPSELLVLCILNVSVLLVSNGKHVDTFNGTDNIGHLLYAESRRLVSGALCFFMALQDQPHVRQQSTKQLAARYQIEVRDQLVQLATLKLPGASGNFVVDACKKPADYISQKIAATVFEWPHSRASALGVFARVGDQHADAKPKVRFDELPSDISANQIVKEWVANRGLLPSKQFAVALSIRLCRAGNDVKARQQFVQISLLATHVLMTFSSQRREFYQILCASKPELVSDICDVIKSATVSTLIEQDTVPLDIHTVCISTLAAMLQSGQVRTAVRQSTSWSPAVLLLLLRQAMNSSLRSDDENLTADFFEYTITLIDMFCKLVARGARESLGIVPLDFFELFLNTSVDINMRSAHILSACLDTITEIVNVSAGAAIQKFHQLNGLDKCVARLESLLDGLEFSSSSSSLLMGLPVSDIGGRLYDLDRRIATADIAWYKQIIVTMLGIMSQCVRRHRQHIRMQTLRDGTFASLIKRIWELSKPLHGLLGEDVWVASCSLTSCIIQNQPAIMKDLHQLGITATYLSHVNSDTVRRSSVIRSIPEMLRSFCLTPAGLEAVKLSNSVDLLISLFSDADIKIASMLDRAMVSLLGRSLDELFRHHRDFAQPGLVSVIHLLDRLIDMISEIPSAVERAVTLNLQLIATSRLVELLLRHFMSEFVQLDGPNKLFKLIELRFSCPTCCGVYSHESVGKQSSMDGKQLSLITFTGLIGPLMSLASRQPAVYATRIVQLAIDHSKSIVNRPDFTSGMWLMLPLKHDFLDVFLLPFVREDVDVSKVRQSLTTVMYLGWLLHAIARLLRRISLSSLPERWLFELVDSCSPIFQQLLLRVSVLEAAYLRNTSGVIGSQCLSRDSLSGVVSLNNQATRAVWFAQCDSTSLVKQYHAIISRIIATSHSKLFQGLLKIARLHQASSQRHASHHALCSRIYANVGKYFANLFQPFGTSVSRFDSSLAANAMSTSDLSLVSMIMHKQALQFTRFQIFGDVRPSASIMRVRPSPIQPASLQFKHAAMQFRAFGGGHVLLQLFAGYLRQYSWLTTKCSPDWSAVYDNRLSTIEQILVELVTIFDVQLSNDLREASSVGAPTSTSASASVPGSGTSTIFNADSLELVALAASAFSSTSGSANQAMPDHDVRHLLDPVGKPRDALTDRLANKALSVFWSSNTSAFLSPDNDDMMSLKLPFSNQLHTLPLLVISQVFKLTHRVLTLTELTRSDPISDSATATSISNTQHHSTSPRADHSISYRAEQALSGRRTDTLDPLTDAMRSTLDTLSRLGFSRSISLHAMQSSNSTEIEQLVPILLEGGSGAESSVVTSETVASSANEQKISKKAKHAFDFGKNLSLSEVLQSAFDSLLSIRITEAALFPSFIVPTAADTPVGKTVLDMFVAILPLLVSEFDSDANATRNIGMILLEKTDQRLLSTVTDVNVIASFIRAAILHNIRCCAISSSSASTLIADVDCAMSIHGRSLTIAETGTQKQEMQLLKAYIGNCMYSLDVLLEEQGSALHTVVADQRLEDSVHDHTILSLSCAARQFDLLRLCTKLLAMHISDFSQIIIQILLRLTRHRPFADWFVAHGGMHFLVSVQRSEQQEQSSEPLDLQITLTHALVRRLITAHTGLLKLMIDEIEAYFKTIRNMSDSKLDTNTITSLPTLSEFLISMRPLILRDIDCFMHAVKSTCELVTEAFPTDVSKPDFERRVRMRSSVYDSAMLSDATMSASDARSSMRNVANTTTTPRSIQLRGRKKQRSKSVEPLHHDVIDVGIPTTPKTDTKPIKARTLTPKQKKMKALVGAKESDRAYNPDYQALVAVRILLDALVVDLNRCLQKLQVKVHGRTLQAPEKMRSATMCYTCWSTCPLTHSGLSSQLCVSKRGKHPLSSRFKSASFMSPFDNSVFCMHSVDCESAAPLLDHAQILNIISTQIDQHPTLLHYFAKFDPKLAAAGCEFNNTLTLLSHCLVLDPTQIAFKVATICDFLLVFAEQAAAHGLPSAPDNLTQLSIQHALSKQVDKVKQTSGLGTVASKEITSKTDTPNKASIATAAGIELLAFLLKQINQLLLCVLVRGLPNPRSFRKFSPLPAMPNSSDKLRAVRRRRDMGITAQERIAEVYAVSGLTNMLLAAFTKMPQSIHDVTGEDLSTTRRRIMQMIIDSDAVNTLSCLIEWIDFSTLQKISCGTVRAVLQLLNSLARTEHEEVRRKEHGHRPSSGTKSLFNRLSAILSASPDSSNDGEENIHDAEMSVDSDAAEGDESGLHDSEADDALELVLGIGGSEDFDDDSVYEDGDPEGSSDAFDADEHDEFSGDDALDDVEFTGIEFADEPDFDSDESSGSEVEDSMHADETGAHVVSDDSDAIHNDDDHSLHDHNDYSDVEDDDMQDDDDDDDDDELADDDADDADDGDDHDHYDDHDDADFNPHDNYSEEEESERSSDGYFDDGVDNYSHRYRRHGTGSSRHIDDTWGNPLPSSTDARGDIEYPSTFGTQWPTIDATLNGEDADMDMDDNAPSRARRQLPIGTRFVPPLFTPSGGLVGVIDDRYDSMEEDEYDDGAGISDLALDDEQVWQVRLMNSTGRTDNSEINDLLFRAMRRGSQLSSSVPHLSRDGARNTSSMSTAARNSNIQGRQLAQAAQSVPAPAQRGLGVGIRNIGAPRGNQPSAHPGNDDLTVISHNDDRNSASIPASLRQRLSNVFGSAAAGLVDRVHQQLSHMPVIDISGLVGTRASIARSDGPSATGANPNASQHESKETISRASHMTPSRIDTFVTGLADRWYELGDDANLDSDVITGLVQLFISQMPLAVVPSVVPADLQQSQQSVSTSSHAIDDQSKDVGSLSVEANRDSSSRMNTISNSHSGTHFETGASASLNDTGRPFHEDDNEGNSEDADLQLAMALSIQVAEANSAVMQRSSSSSNSSQHEEHSTVGHTQNNVIFPSERQSSSNPDVGAIEHRRDAEHEQVSSASVSNVSAEAVCETVAQTPQDELLQPVAASSSMVDEIDESVLNELPPEIRFEILEQRRLRQQFLNSESQPANLAAAAELDTASFILTLEPEMRDDFLINCEDDVLMTLPSNLLADAIDLRNRAGRYYDGFFGRSGSRSTGNDVIAASQPVADSTMSVPTTVNEPPVIEHRSYSPSLLPSKSQPFPPFANPQLVRDNLVVDLMREHRSCILDTALLTPLFRCLYAIISDTAAQKSQILLLQRLLNTLCFHKRVRVHILATLFRLLNPNSGAAMRISLAPTSTANSTSADSIIFISQSLMRTTELLTGLCSLRPSTVSSFCLRPQLLNKPPGAESVPLIQLFELLRFLLDSEGGSTSRECIPYVLKAIAFIVDLPLKLEIELRVFLESSENASSYNIITLDESRNNLPEAFFAPYKAHSRTASSQAICLNEEPAMDTEPEANFKDENQSGKQVLVRPFPPCPEISPELILAVLDTLFVDNISQGAIEAVVKIILYIASSANGYRITIEQLAVFMSRLCDRLQKELIALTRATEKLSDSSISDLSSISASKSLLSTETALLRLLKVVGSLNLVDADPRWAIRIPAIYLHAYALSTSAREIGKGVLNDTGAFRALQLVWIALDEYLTASEIASAAAASSSAVMLNAASAKAADTGFPDVQASTLSSQRVEDFPIASSSRETQDLLSCQDSLTESRETDILLTMHVELIQCYFVLGDSSESGSNVPVLDTGAAAAAAVSTDVPLSLRRLNSPNLIGRASNVSSLPEGWLTFSWRHRRLLNVICRNNPQLIRQGGAMHRLLSHPLKVLDFDLRRKHFKNELKRLNQHQRVRNAVRLAVRREQIFEDSFEQLRRFSAQDIKGRLSVKFFNEEGLDAGGLSRDWFISLSRAVFNPDYAMFTPAVNNPAVFQPNKYSYLNPDHLDYFRFIGTFVGKAIWDQQRLDAYFTRSFYKHILGVPITFHDIESIDPDYYKNLVWMLENSIEGVAELSFSAESDAFGKTEIVDLVPNGRSIQVTDENKPEYVNIMADHIMTSAIRKQIDAFLQGFHSIIPASLIGLFNENELELLICGLPTVDINDMRANVEYHNWKDSDQVIQWLWQLVEDMSQEDRALFVQFITGTSKIPLEGFKALVGSNGPQLMQIHKSHPSNSLPLSHTCFNQLDLPHYDSYQLLRDKVLMAIRECRGFGFR